MDRNDKVKIVIKEGWQLNPDINKVNQVLINLAKTGGCCPSVKPERIGHNQCPCASYLEHDECYCNLYIKKENNEKD